MKSFLLLLVAVWFVQGGKAEVVLNLDCIQRGLGNASCGPGPRPAYEIQKNTI